MKQYAWYISPKDRDMALIDEERLDECEQVCLDYTYIYVHNISNSGKLILTTEKNIPLYVFDMMDVYIYFENFCEKIDENQAEKLREWFYESEYAVNQLENF